MKYFSLLFISLIFFVSCSDPDGAEYFLPLENYKSSLSFLDNGIPLYMNQRPEDHGASLLTIRIEVPGEVTEAFAGYCLPELLELTLKNEAGDRKYGSVFDIEYETGSKLAVSRKQSDLFFTIRFADSDFRKVMEWVREAFFEKKIITPSLVKSQVDYIVENQTPLYRLFHKASAHCNNRRFEGFNALYLKQISSHRLSDILRDLLSVNRISFFLRAGVHKPSAYQEMNRHFSSYAYVPPEAYSSFADSGEKDPDDLFSSTDSKGKSTNEQVIFLESDSAFPYTDVWFYRIEVPKTFDFLYDFMEIGSNQALLYKARSCCRETGRSVYEFLTSVPFADHKVLFLKETKQAFRENKMKILSNMVTSFKKPSASGVVFFSEVLSGSVKKFQTLKDLTYEDYRKLLRDIKVSHEKIIVRKPGISELYKSSLTESYTFNNRRYVYRPGQNHEDVFFLSR